MNVTAKLSQSLQSTIQQFHKNPRLSQQSSAGVRAMSPAEIREFTSLNAEYLASLKSQSQSPGQVQYRFVRPLANQPQEQITQLDGHWRKTQAGQETYRATFKEAVVSKGQTPTILDGEWLHMEGCQTAQGLVALTISKTADSAKIGFQATQVYIDRQHPENSLIRQAHITAPRQL